MHSNVYSAPSAEELQRSSYAGHSHPLPQLLSGRDMPLTTLQPGFHPLSMDTSMHYPTLSAAAPFQATTTPAAALAAAPSTAASNLPLGKKTGKLRLSFVTASDQAKFEELFKSAVGNSIVIREDVAKSIMSKSCLTPSVLAKIWEHSDTTKSGQLMMPEFILAMHLCDMAMSGKSVPDKIPDVIYDEVFDMVSFILLSMPDSTQSDVKMNIQDLKANIVPPPTTLSASQNVQALPISQADPMSRVRGFQPSFLQTSTTNFRSFTSPTQPSIHPTSTQYMSSSIQPSYESIPNYRMQVGNMDIQKQWGVADNTQRKLSGIDALELQLMPQPGKKQGFSALDLHGSAQLSWAITKDERRVYDNIFKAWNGHNTGFINGHTAVEIFSQSGLSKKDLELIWTLADSENRGRLNNDEFCIALHLIYRKLNGYEIPLKLPQELVLQSSKDFSDSVDQIKSLLRNLNSQQKQPFSFQTTDYVKSNKFNDDPFQTYRKDALIYKHDNKTGYIPSSRRKEEESFEGYRSSFLHASSKEPTIQSSKFKEKNLNTANQNEKYESEIKKNKNEIKHLYRQIRHIQEEINTYPDSSLLLIDMEDEHKNLTQELQDLSDELPSIISKIRKVEQEIANAKLELFKIRHAKNNPELSTTIEGSKEITDINKRKTKAATMLKARMAILTGESISSEDNDYDRRYAEAIFLINKEKESNENTISSIEESAEQLKSDLEYKLKNFQENFFSNNYQRIKWNKGIDVQDDVRKFIFDLQKTSNSQEKKDLNFCKKNQSADTSINQLRVDILKTAQSTSTHKDNFTDISTDKDKDKTAWIKAEAERRINERLAILGIEPYKKSPESNDFSIINEKKIDILKEAEKKKKRDKELEKERENSRLLRITKENEKSSTINKIKNKDKDQKKSISDQDSKILDEKLQEKNELLVEKAAQEERIEKLKKDIELKNAKKAFEIKKREKKRDLYAKEEELRKLKEEMESKKQEEILLLRKRDEMEEEIKKLSLENDEEYKDNNESKANLIQQTSETNPFFQYNTSESCTSSNKPNNPFSSMLSQNKFDSSLDSLHTSSIIQISQSPPSVSTLKTSHSDRHIDSNTWSASQYTSDSDSSDNDITAKKSPAQLASFLIGAMESNKISSHVNKNEVSEDTSKHSEIELPKAHSPLASPLPSNNTNLHVHSPTPDRHALLNQIQKGTKLKKTPVIRPRSSSILGKVL